MSKATAEPSTRKGVLARAALMDAGIGLIAEKGVNGFSIGELCAKAKLNRTSFYTYFASTDELVWALWQREALMFHERFRAPRPNLERGAETLCVNILGMFTIAREDAEWNKFSMQLFASNTDIRNAWVQAVAIDIAAAVEAGHFVLDDDEQLAFTQLAIGAIFSTALNLEQDVASEESSWRIMAQLFHSANMPEDEFQAMKSSVLKGDKIKVT